MSFTDTQVRQLRSSIRRRHVREREVEGKTLHYLEGWWIVSEANRIFGFDAWERETASSECVWRSPVGERFGAAYLTRVRISVRAGERVIIREGLGAGEAVAPTPGQAHERASKAAETDATKRALSTFGSRFGLSLYGERGDAAKIPSERVTLDSAATRVVRSVRDRMRSTAKPGEPIASTAREVTDKREADAGWRRTRGQHPFTRVPAPGAKEPARDIADAQRGGPPVHYGASDAPALTEAPTSSPAPPLAPISSDADTARPLSASGPPGPDHNEEVAATPSTEGREVALLPVYLPPPSPPQRIDKSVLAIPEPRRLRDRHHLKFVAKQACLVCGRSPSQAHHLRIAQPRALGRKVSDEFVVPLCALHHHDLHMRGNEGEWWWGRAIEPLPIAERLWRESRGLPATRETEAS